MPSFPPVSLSGLFLAVLDNDLDAIAYARAYRSFDPVQQLTDSEIRSLPPRLMRQLSPFVGAALPHVCAAAGNVGLFQEMLEYPGIANLEAANASKWTPLAVATARGRSEIMRLLLSRSDRTQMQAFCTPEGDTLLHLAADIARPQSVLALLDSGMPQDARDRKGHLPFFRCLRPTKRPEMRIDVSGTLKAFVEHASWSKVRDHVVVRDTDRAQAHRQARSGVMDGWLHEAAAIRSLEAMHLLLGSGFGPNQCRQPGGSTAFHAACAALQPLSIRFLLDHGADVTCTWQGKSPLHIALESARECYALAKNGRKIDDCIKAITLLVEAGCDPAARNNDDVTPLAVAENMPEVLAVMTAHQAKKAIQTVLGRASASASG